MQRIVAVADRFVMKTRTPSRRSRPSRTIPATVVRMVGMIAPYEADGGRRYVRLARAVERHLARRGGARWDALKIEEFVREHAPGRDGAIETCCNLSAMFPWMIHAKELSGSDARRLYEELAQTCPDDPLAQSYIRLGHDQFVAPPLH